jgi:hypothetical protein
LLPCCAVLLLCCNEDVPSIRSSALAIPTTKISPSQRISGIDAVADEEETLYVAGITTEPVTGKNSLFFVRGEKGGATWSAPIPLKKTDSRQARILISAHGMHLMSGLKLDDVYSADGGRSWTEREPMLKEADDHALTFDAAVVDKGIVVMYVEHDNSSGKLRQQGPDTPFIIKCLTFSDDGTVSTKVIASLSATDAPSIRIARGSEGLLHCFFSVNQGIREMEGDRAKYAFSSALYHMESIDDGLTWSRYAAVPFDVRNIAASVKEGIQFISGPVDTLLVNEHLFVFMADETNIYMTSSQEGRAWAPLVILTRQYRRSAAGGFSARSVTTAKTQNGEGRIAWIDTRFGKSDRKWWKPFGGFPWSDDPEWANNDVFSVPLSKVMEGLHAGRVITPQRLTKPLSYAGQVKLAASRSSYYAVWFGKRRVAKTLESSEVPWEIFYERLSADSR